MGDESETSPTGQKLFFDEHPRLLGVVFFALAIIFAPWAFYFPIHEALQGVPKITLYPKAIYACVMFTIFGVICILLGPKTYNLAVKYIALRGWKKWLTIAVILTPLILIAEQVKQVLEQYLEGFGFKF
jgi:hypothetical protein